VRELAALDPPSGAAASDESNDGEDVA